MLNKSEAEAIMKTLPVTLPYCDWDWLRGISATPRHTLATNVLTEKSEGIDEIKALGIDIEKHLPEFSVARWMAGERFIRWLDAAMEKSGVRSVPAFFAGLDMDMTIITRIRRKQRPFSIPVSALEAVGNRMGISVHDLLFGEAGVLELSALPSLNALVCELNTLDEETLVRLTTEAKLAAIRFRKEALAGGEGESGHCTGINRLFVKRLAWYTRENDLRPVQAFGRSLDTTPHRIHNSMHSILGEKQYEAKLPVLMEAALSTRLALDFFVKDDPTTYVEIVAVDKDGKTVKISSPELVRFLSCLFLVEDDQRIRLTKQAWNAVMGSILKKAVD